MLILYPIREQLFKNPVTAAAVMVSVVYSLKQSITVGDVDLSINDVSRLREEWESSPFSISAPPVYDEAGHHNVRLVFAGKDLEAGQPLKRYGLVRGSIVQVLGRLKGGAQLGKVVKGRSQVGIL